jgi:serine/threonine protein kinase
MPENVYIGLDDKPRLGHLHTMVDQHADRPKSRLGMLDYMAPELFSIRAADEVELSLLQGDSDEEGEEMQQQQQAQVSRDLQQSQYEGQGSGSNVVHPDRQVEQQQRQQPGLVRLEHGLDTSSLRARAGLEDVQLPGTCSSISSRGIAIGAEHSISSSACGPQRSSYEVPAQPRNWDGRFLDSMQDSSQELTQSNQQYCKAGWEQLDYYDEKVDIWQVGCLVHEILCGSLPFEVSDHKRSWSAMLCLRQMAGGMCTILLQQARS